MGIWNCALILIINEEKKSWNNHHEHIHFHAYNCFNFSLKMKMKMKMRGNSDFLQPYSPLYPSAAGGAVDLPWAIHAREGAPILMGKKLKNFFKVLIMGKKYWTLKLLCFQLPLCITEPLQSAKWLNKYLGAATALGSSYGTSPAAGSTGSRKCHWKPLA